jgi:hypothetical protein
MNALVGGLLALLIYPALTWAVLRLAQFFAVQQGALHPAKTSQPYSGGI